MKLSIKKLFSIKRVSTKYMLIFMALMIATVVILGIIVGAIISNFSLNVRMKELSNINTIFKSYFSELPKDDLTLEDSLQGREGEINKLLSIAFVTSPYSHVFLTDENGEIIFFANRDEETGENRIIDGENLGEHNTPLKVNVLSSSALKILSQSNDISINDDLNGTFSRDVIVFGSTLKGNDGEVEGYLVSFLMGAREGDLMSEMMKSMIITVIWITIAALVAIYGVSYRAMRPLREISKAAKDFAKGKFDVRIPERGDDELTELARSFNTMVSAIQSKDEMQKSFLSSASHDLRTPMTTIAGFIDSILDGAIPPEKQDYYLNIIKNEIKRLSRLVTSLLDISRLQSGDRKFDIKPFNICELARQTVISFETQFEIKELDVEFDCDDFDMMVLGDKDAINQVVYNLCHNAIKFSYEKGKYRVGIKNAENNKVRISIYNEGIGIKKEELPYVFDRFYKGDKSRGLDKTGVGLGLFISKTIIEAHEEQITVQSDYGKFCEFAFTLPKGE